MKDSAGEDAGLDVHVVGVLVADEQAAASSFYLN